MPAANFQSVNADGWSVTYASPPTFDPVGSPEAATVTSPGYDASGASVSVVEDVICMDRMRQAYPSQASLTADQVALSNYIYSGDTISGSPVNNSTRLAPKPQAMWLNHDRDIVTSTFYTLRLAVAHGHARSGKPVAAVKFRLSDGTTTVEQLVIGMSVKSYSATGLSVPHFAGVMDTTTLIQGALLTADAIIYPWKGAPFQISVDADAYPSPNLTTLRILNDRTGAYGTAYTYVDSTLGNDGTGVASATPATAAALPFLTIAAAATAVKAYIAANFGRASDAGGGIIRLVEGTHTHSNFKTAGTGVDIPLVIEAADPTKQTTTIWQDTGATQTITTPDKLKIKGITLRKQGASVTFLDSNGGSSGKLIVQDCIWDQNGKSSYGAWVYRVGIFTQINCSGASLQSAAFSTVYKAVNLIGCATAFGDAVFHAICSTGSRLDAKAASGSMPAVAGFFIGWCRMSATSGANRIIGVDVPQGARGMAIVGNLVESAGTHNAPAIQIAADGNKMAVENCIIQGNTIVGDRSNVLYLDVSTNVLKSSYVSDNVVAEINIKSDVFAANGALVGNWSVRYKVGWRGNYAYAGASNGSTYSPTSWLGEIPSLGEVINGTPNFTNDQSHDGGNAANGNYAPTAGTSIPLIPAGKAAYPYDLLGQAIADDGTAHAGAVQMLSTGSTGTGAATISINAAGSGEALAQGVGAAGLSLSVGGQGQTVATGTGGAILGLSVSGQSAAVVQGQGAASISLAAAGSASALASAQGAALIDLAASGSGQAPVLGTASILIGISANGSGPTLGDITGQGAAVLSLSIGGSGTVLTEGQGSAALSLSAAGVGQAQAAAQGAASIGLSASGAANALVDARGSFALDLVISGAGQAQVIGQGAALISLSVSGSDGSTEDKSLRMAGVNHQHTSIILIGGNAI